MRNFLRQFVLVAIGAGSWLAGSAAIPAGYYSSLKGKSLEPNLRPQSFR